MKYEVAKNGEWIRPDRQDYKIACCSCGLVHDMDFRIYKRHIEFRVRRNNRSTGQLRRHLKKDK